MFDRSFFTVSKFNFNFLWAEGFDFELGFIIILLARNISQLSFGASFDYYWLLGVAIPFGVVEMLLGFNKIVDGEVVFTVE